MRKQAFALLLGMLVAFAFIPWYMKPLAKAETTIFSDGFESGTILTTDVPPGAWTSIAVSSGSSATTTTDSPHHGVYNAKFIAGSSGWACVKESFTAAATAFVRGYYTFNTLPGVGEMIYLTELRVFSDEGVGVALENTDGNLFWLLRIAELGVSTEVYEAVASNSVAGVPYCVEVKRDVTNGLEELWIDGVSRASANQSITRDSSEIVVGYGYSTSVNQQTCYADCVVVSDSYIGLEEGHPPSISILSPINTTYATADVPLTFTVNETTSWMGYSGDGQDNVTIAGNTTLTGLSQGSHQVVVYANDTFGNMGSSENVYFIVQTTSQITFEQTGISTDFPDTILVVDEADYNVTDLPVSFGWAVGSNHTFAFRSPLLATTHTEQYVWVNSTGLSTEQNGSVLVTFVSGSIIANYETQYYLMVDSPHDDPTPSSGWFDPGTIITESISSPSPAATGTRYVCTGWTGTGSVPPSGTALNVTFTLNEASSMTWVWKTQYLLTVLTDPPGLSPQPYVEPTGEVSADGWWYDIYSEVSLTAQSVREKVFNNWDIDGFSQGNGTNPITIVMNEPHTGTAHYIPIPQFLVTFNRTGLDDTATGTVVTVNGSAKNYADLPFSQSVEQNSRVDYVYENIVGTSVSGKRFELVDVIGPGSPVNMTGDTTLTGNYETQYYFTVSSVFGSPFPTSGWNTAGTEIAASVISPVSGPDGTRYVCIGWTGTGSVPASGTGTSVTFTLTEPSSITWNWKTQYILTVLTEPSGLLPPIRNPLGETGGVESWWYDVSVNVSLTASDVGFASFEGWDVDGVNQSLGVNPITLTIDAPHIATAYYLTPDIAVESVVPSKTVVGQGYSMVVNATVTDLGFSAEIFNITVYANNIPIENQTVLLSPGDSLTAYFTWNTSGLVYGNYTISACAWPVHSEINIANNNYTSSTEVHVGVPGDVSSSAQGVYDKKCDMKDIAYLVILFNTKPTSSNWNPNADVDNNGVVNMIDIAIAIINFNKHE